MQINISNIQMADRLLCYNCVSVTRITKPSLIGPYHVCGNALGCSTLRASTFAPNIVVKRRGAEQ